MNEVSKNTMPNFQLCVQCKFVLTKRSLKYYCCNKKQPVCIKCINIPCEICKMLRTNRLNTTCFKCRISYEEDYIFYDFKSNLYYCAKCLCKQYAYHYQQMLKDGTEPKSYTIEISSKSKYSLEDLINFYKNWCFCCAKKFNNNAFEMIHGARICTSCLESNFDIAMSKLIICVQCNGYVHSTIQIQFQISLNQVLCVYCSKDVKKNEDALIKKNEALSLKISKVKGKSSLKNSSVIVSAVQISRIGISKMKKIISKSSIQQESLDIPIKVNLQSSSSHICIVCNCKFNQKSVFQLAKEEIDKYKQAKQDKYSVICFVCFNNRQKQIYKPQKLQRIFGISQKDLQQQQSQMNTAKIRSTQVIPKSRQRNILKSPTVKQRVSPKNKQILCQKCKKAKGSIETKKGFFCLKCLD